MAQQPNNNVYPNLVSPPATPSYPQQPNYDGYAYSQGGSATVTVVGSSQVPQRPPAYYPQGSPVELDVNNVGYVHHPQQQSGGYDKLEELPFDDHPSASPSNGANEAGHHARVTPYGIENGNVSQEILSQDYHVTVTKWFSEAWVVYKQHWIVLGLLTLLQILVSSFLPHFGAILVYPLYFGVFIAVTHKIRHNGLNGELKYEHLLYGYLYILPLFLILLMCLVSITFGFILCIIPGFYAMIALAFAAPLFLEYHDQNVGLIGSMLLSVKVVNKHLCEMIFFLILNFLFGISGLLLLGVGVLLTLPMAQLATIMAFKDMFGLNPHKVPQVRFVICS